MRQRLSVLLWFLLCTTAQVEAVETCTDKTGQCDWFKYAATPPCYFPTTFLEVPLIAEQYLNHNTKKLTFGLPEGISLNLPVSSAIVMNATPYSKDGKELSKPYNPISSNLALGYFDLLVKVYAEGKASKFAGLLKVGDYVGFKQVKSNVKPWRYPFGKKSITMLAGGTGIAPMYQALLPLLQTSGDTTQIRLLFGNLAPPDILLKDEIDKLAEEHPDRLKVTYIVGKTPDDVSAATEYGWTGEMGWIDQEKISRLAFPPADGTVVWVCGVDAMYNSLAGSRAGKLKPGSILHELGYSGDMIWRS